MSNVAIIKELQGLKRHGMPHDQPDRHQRLIGNCRREFTDRIIFWNKTGLSGKTPAEITGQRQLSSIDMKNLRWQSVCGGMYKTKIPA